MVWYIYVPNFVKFSKMNLELCHIGIIIVFALASEAKFLLLSFLFFYVFLNMLLLELLGVFKEALHWNLLFSFN